MPPEIGMQPIPGCRIRVWKKEWQQTVGSQTSLLTRTRRIANRNEQREKKGNKGNKREENGGSGTKYRKEKTQRKRGKSQGIRGKDRIKWKRESGGQRGKWVI